MARDTDPQTDADATIVAPAARWRAPASEQPMPQMATATRAPQPSPFPFPRAAAAEPRLRAVERDQGRRAPAAVAPPVPLLPTHGPNEAALRAVLDVYQDNPGLALAVPVLEILVRAQLQPTGDADALHDLLLDELQNFETHAIARGLSHQHTRLILYAIAATADDCVLHTAWGNESDWAAKTLVSALFQETWGGERFFGLLNQMMAAPHSVVREIEFYYFCLQFGFEGKYRLAANGAGELTRLKEDVFQFLRSVRGGVKPELSPSWRGIAAESKGPGDFLPLLFYGIGVLAFLIILFLGYSIVLRRQATLASQEVQALMTDPVIAKPVPVPVVPPPPAPAPAPVTPPAPAQTPLQVIGGFLEPEQKAGLIKVFARGNTVVIQTQQELFASASTALRPPYPEVVSKIAAALAKFKGPVQVLGYTDDIPIRSATFPDNLALSTARARAVGQALASGLGGNTRITTEGKGDADPVASNATPDGRQKNRRVEIILTPQ
ncbi:hypothetical protein GCM10007301_16850 [Azorhizobium oxalatiphilum]|uniref:OmpA-like domain-containing protein n=1 Tax=Azorhizobium oxalatiphilum TaxID=980631 RepID=A0A917BWS6_9HYPH|nr:type IVB secretion system protein IcmH/DotU [Azorhizobium oxalatiphilum]GGF57761.1 hypothetical protein GCM10007301_16850 [Azorhizobium oxalatiphilum]